MLSSSVVEAQDQVMRHTVSVVLVGFLKCGDGKRVEEGASSFPGYTTTVFYNDDVHTLVCN